MLSKLLIGLITLLGCAGGPDELHLGYGHTFTGDSSLEAWPIYNEDSSFLTVGFVWRLTPTEVFFRGLPPREQQDPIKELAPVLPLDVEDVTSQVEESLSFFDTLNWLTRVLLLVLACTVIWVFRAQIGRLIPKFGNNKKNNSK